jgi:hypothetical protein
MACSAGFGSELARDARPGVFALARGLPCLRSLVEVAGWVATGTVLDHHGHPWLVTGRARARRLSGLVGSPVRPT